MVATVVVFDEAALAAARAEVSAARRFVDGAYDYNDDAAIDEANARYAAATARLAELAMPPALRARRLSDLLAQDAENKAVEALAIRTAAAQNIGVNFLPCFWIEGHDDSFEMIAWPNGEVTEARHYDEWLRQQRLAANPYL